MFYLRSRSLFNRRVCGAAAAVVALLLFACSLQNTTTVNRAPGPVLSSVALNELGQGGYRNVPAGEDLAEAFENSALIKREGVFRYLPSVSIKQEIVPSTAGNGFDYRLRWEYTPASEMKAADLGVTWVVYEDPTANPSPAGAWEAFSRNLRVRRTFAMNAEREHVIRNLLPGRRYVYYVGGNFLGGRESDRLVVAVQAIYLRVVVDLTRPL